VKLTKRIRISPFELLSLDLLREFAGEPSYARGARYFEEGRVTDIRVERDHVIAKVRGTHPYKVELRQEGGELNYSCTCPFFQDETAFCKHCVAAGLAALDQIERVQRSGVKNGASRREKRLAERELGSEEVEEFLKGQDKATLVSLLVQHADEDERFKSRLSMQAGKGKHSVHLPTFRKAIDRAVNWGEYVDYKSMYEYVQGVEEVINSLRELLKENHAPEVLELCEHFLRTLEVQMEMVDDSDGYMRGILSDVEEIHHAACIKLKPDPEGLARKLFAWGLRSDWEVFYNAAQSYADVLGKPGLKVFRALAEERWRRIRPLKPGEENREYEKERFRITSIMEQLAAQTGDVEALVAVKAKNLATAYAYLEIAKLYRSAKKDAKALEWAKEGVKVFPEGTDSRLREFLAAEYHKRKQHQEAMQLIWDEFADHPGFEEYRLLKSHAELAGGSSSWKTWREKGLQFLRQENSTDGRKAKEKHFGWRSRDRSTLVKIFLWEKDVEQAWQEAQEGGCDESLWLDLAAARETDHPEDAVAVYRNFVEPAVRRMDNQSYQEAAGFVRKVRKLLRRLGREEEWQRYVESLRTTHRRKRNFMKLLEQLTE
jgi:uncharacterized Zn finger protein